MKFYLQAIAYNCRELQTLNLGWCENVGDLGVTSLAYGCPDLRALDLCGCVLITGIFVGQLVFSKSFLYRSVPIGAETNLCD